MKKLFYTIAALMCCMSAFAQEEAEEGNSISFGVVGRLDAVGEFPFNSEEKPSYNSGNSSIYTKFESNFAKYFNVTWIGHWATTESGKIPFYGTPASEDEEAFRPTRALYKNSLETWASTWTDYLYLDFNYNGFNARIGKDCLALGGFDYEKWDWEVDYALASSFWMNNASYQWGAQIGYTTPSESSSFVFQVQSSPFTYMACGEDCNKAYPWAHGLGSYSFKYTGEYGPMSLSASYNFLQASEWSKETQGLNILALGVMGNICDVANIGVDWYTRADNISDVSFFKQSQQFDLFADWEINDYVTLEGKYGFEKINSAIEADMFEAEPFSRHWGGVSAIVTPIQSFDALKIAATLGGYGKKIGDETERGMNATLTLLIDWSFTKVFSK